MRALSIRQPYAELIQRGVKTIEYRSRPTSDGTLWSSMDSLRLPLRFALDKTYSVVLERSREFLVGELYHHANFASGGATLTPVGSFHAWRPDPVPEDSNPHWRIDVHIRVHQLSPDPKHMGQLLVKELLSRSLCTEPLWIQCYRSEETWGQEYGELAEEQ